MFLVPADAVERFGDDDLDLAREAFVEQGLDAGAQKASAAQGGVGIDPGRRPAETHDKFFAKPDLIFNRGVTLIVGGIASIDYGTHDDHLHRYRRRDLRISRRRAAMNF